MRTIAQYPAETGARLTANVVSKKVTGNESVRRCVEGVRAAAARCGPLRTGATGLEPAASGVTERCSAAQSACKNADWERPVVRRHLLRPAGGRCEPHAHRNRCSRASTALSEDTSHRDSDASNRQTHVAAPTELRIDARDEGSQVV